MRSTGIPVLRLSRHFPMSSASLASPSLALHRPAPHCLVPMSPSPASPSPHRDPNLVGRIRRGDAAAFELLFRTCRAEVRRFSVSYVDSVAVAFRWALRHPPTRRRRSSTNYEVQRDGKDRGALLDGTFKAERSWGGAMGRRAGLQGLQ